MINFFKLNQIKLTALNDDTPSSTLFFNLYSTPYLNKDWFSLDSNSGVLKLIQGLDRDPPRGRPEYLLPVSG